MATDKACIDLSQDDVDHESAPAISLKREAPRDDAAHSAQDDTREREAKRSRSGVAASTEESSRRTLQQENESLNQTVRELRSELERSQKLGELYFEDRRADKAKIKRLETQVATQQELRAERDAARNELEKVKAERDAARNELDKVKMERQALSLKKERVENVNEDASKLINQSMDESSELKSALAEAKAENQRLRRESHERRVNQEAGVLARVHELEQAAQVTEGEGDDKDVESGTESKSDDPQDDDDDDPEHVPPAASYEVDDDDPTLSVEEQEESDEEGEDHQDDDDPDYVDSEFDEDRTHGVHHGENSSENEEDVQDGVGSNNGKLYFSEEKDGKNACKWQKMFEEWEQFKNEYGDMRVPSSGKTKPLYVWCRIQRLRYKKTTKDPTHKTKRTALTRTQYNKVDSTGFVFEMVYEKMWDEKFAKLKEL